MLPTIGGYLREHSDDQIEHPCDQEEHPYRSSTIYMVGSVESGEEVDGAKSYGAELDGRVVGVQHPKD